MCSMYPASPSSSPSVVRVSESLLPSPSATQQQHEQQQHEQQQQQQQQQHYECTSGMSSTSSMTPVLGRAYSAARRPPPPTPHHHHHQQQLLQQPHHVSASACMPPPPPPPTAPLLSSSSSLRGHYYCTDSCYVVLDDYVPVLLPPPFVHSRTLFLHNLPPGIENRTGLMAYVPPGGLVSLRVKRTSHTTPPRNVAFAQYNTQDAAQRALQWFFHIAVLRAYALAGSAYTHAHAPPRPSSLRPPLSSCVPRRVGPLLLPPYRDYDEYAKHPELYAAVLMECVVLMVEWCTNEQQQQQQQQQQQTRQYYAAAASTVASVATPAATATTPQPQPQPSSSCYRDVAHTRHGDDDNSYRTGSTAWLSSTRTPTRVVATASTTRSAADTSRATMRVCDTPPYDFYSSIASSGGGSNSYRDSTLRDEHSVSYAHPQPHHYHRRSSSNSSSGGGGGGCSRRRSAAAGVGVAAMTSATMHDCSHGDAAWRHAPASSVYSSSSNSGSSSRYRAVPWPDTTATAAATMLSSSSLSCSSPRQQQHRHYFDHHYNHHYRLSTPAHDAVAMTSQTATGAVHTGSATAASASPLHRPPTLSRAHATRTSTTTAAAAATTTHSTCHDDSGCSDSTRTTACGCVHCYDDDRASSARACMDMSAAAAHDVLPLRVSVPPDATRTTTAAAALHARTLYVYAAARAVPRVANDAGSMRGDYGCTRDSRDRNDSDSNDDCDDCSEAAVQARGGYAEARRLLSPQFLRQQFAGVERVTRPMRDQAEHGRYVVFATHQHALNCLQWLRQHEPAVTLLRAGFARRDSVDAPHAR